MPSCKLTQTTPSNTLNEHPFFARYESQLTCYSSGHCCDGARFIDIHLHCQSAMCRTDIPPLQCRVECTPPIASSEHPFSFRILLERGRRYLHLTCHRASGMLATMCTCPTMPHTHQSTGIAEGACRLASPLGQHHEERLHLLQTMDAINTLFH